ncbi:MAG: methylenetetrahydrofolate reductase [Porticoccaceae bacterium]|nr:MAG: methylenetetrahydrofolate reductase [Porticoccaceae bacterium]
MAEFSLSFEFFPPKTEEGRARLAAVRDRLARLRPAFFSITYGAGGSTRAHTRDLVLEFHRAGHPVAPHLSFGGDDEEAVRELLATYRQAGVRHLVALRGDLPSGMGPRRLVHANELVARVRAWFGDHFHIKVAAYPEIHPEAEGYRRDVHWLAEKFRAGADCALTQYFYNADAYFYFLDECARAGIERPIYPGIMPIANYASLVRFSEKCGAEIPRWLRWRLADFGDDEAGLFAFGVEVVSRLCERLRAGGAPGFHFYTLNRAEASLAILGNLGLA